MCVYTVCTWRVLSLFFIACDEAYRGNGRHLFACQMGCNVTTIDQQIANRDHLYPMRTNASEVGFVFELLATIKQQFPQFMVVNSDLAQLTQHAEKMHQYLPCSEVTSFVLIEDNVSHYIPLCYCISEEPLTCQCVWPSF